jgi:hypothetical protein
MGESCLYKHSGMQTTATDSAFDQLPASLAAWLNGVDTLQQHQRPTATSVPAVAAWSSHPPPPRAYTTKAASVAGTRQESERKTKANEAAAAKGNLAAAAAEAEEAAATKAAAAAEAAAAKEAAAARDAEAAAAATTCGVCTEPHNIRDCVRCPGGHAVCKTCFEDQIGSQTGVEDRDSFIRNGCSIICEFCKPNKVLFRERDFISLVSDDAFQLLTRARDEVTEVRTERRLQAEFEARIERVRQELGRGQEAHAQNVSRHRLHIAENILTLKCPRAQCRRAFLDYTGCMALTCSCGCNFCAWCLQDCANDAHPHVKACPHSQSPGSYHGTFDQFQTVHRNRARLAAQQYLTAVPPGELADVSARLVFVNFNNG